MNEPVDPEILRKKERAEYAKAWRKKKKEKHKQYIKN